MIVVAAASTTPRARHTYAVDEQRLADDAAIDRARVERLEVRLPVAAATGTGIVPPLRSSHVTPAVAKKRTAVPRSSQNSRGRTTPRA